MKRNIALVVMALAVASVATDNAEAFGFRSRWSCCGPRWQPCCQPVYYHPCPPTCVGPVVPGGHVVPDPHGVGGVPGSSGPAAPEVVETKYTAGAKVNRVLYGKNLQPGLKPENLSALKEGDIILAVDGKHVTKNQILIDAKDAAAKAGKAMRLTVYDPATKKAFMHSLNLADPYQLVLEFDVVPVEATLRYYYLSRP